MTAKDEGLETTKEAYVLLIDNQTRCQKLAQRGETLLQAAGGSDSSQTIQQFLTGEGRYDLAVADRSLEITAGLVDLSQPNNPVILQGLALMYNAQSALRGHVKQAGWTGSAQAFRQGVDEQQQQFFIGQQMAGVLLSITNGDRDRIMAKYRASLFDVKAGGLTEQSTDAPLEPVDPLSARKMTPEEYAREKEAYADWLAEQERLERERVEKIQVRQDEVARPAMPKVGVVVPPPPPPPPTRPLADLGAMQSWHRRYLSRIPPVKTAISQYLQSRNSGNKAMLSRSCHKLSQTTSTFLADAAALSVPDPVVQEPLRNAIAAFKDGADACFMGQVDTAKEHVSAAEKFLGEAAQALRPYNLGL